MRGQEARFAYSTATKRHPGGPIAVKKRRALLSIAEAG